MSPSQDPSLENYRAIADGIATLFFPHAEVVLHDLRSQRVDYIANNLSKREVGDDSALEDMLEGDSNERNIGPYEKLNWDGRRSARSAPCCATPPASRWRCCAST